MSEDVIGYLIKRMVEGFSADVEAIQAGVIDGRTPAQARTILAAALVYVVEPIDLTPDHLEGLGLIDDAAMLRLAARTAVAHGAPDEGLKRLGLEAAELSLIFGDLVDSLFAYLERLTGPDRNGKTPDQIIVDPESRMALWRDLNRRREGFKTHSLVATAMNPAELVKTMRTLVRGRLARSGISVPPA